MGPEKLLIEGDRHAPHVGNPSRIMGLAGTTTLVLST